MKKTLYNIIFIIYLIIAIFVTICLLSYNKFKVSEFGDISFVIVDTNKMKPDYKKGDLLIIEKTDVIEEGEKAFFYTTFEKNIEVRLGEITEVEEVSESESTYTVEGKNKISSEYVLGTTDTVNVLPGVGRILGIFESKWGFLFLIVLPALVAFVNQGIVVINAIKSAKGKVKNDKVEKTEE